MGEYEAECIKGVETFKYLGGMLEWSDNDCMSVLRNVGKTRQVWIWLGKLIRQEGEDLRVSETFYQAVVQVVLLFGAETSFRRECMWGSSYK